MNKLSPFLILFILLFSCKGSNATNDLNKMKLNGNIKSIETYKFEAEEKFGVVEKGKPKLFGLDYHELIEFNKNGNNLTRTLFNPNKKILVKWKTTYNQQEEKIEENQYSSDGSLFIKVMHVYDQKGNIVKERRFDNDGIEMSTNEYKYDKLGNLIESNVLEYSNEFKYDDNGNVTEKKVKNRINNTDEIYKYKYDAYNNVIEEISYNNLGKVISTSNFIYTFDKKKNWIKKIEYQNGKAKYLEEREIKY